jgi:hypothetical protein
MADVEEPWRILLPSAGFSRNYGRWLADELTADFMGQVSDDAELPKQLRQQHGVEAAAVTALGSRRWSKQLHLPSIAVIGNRPAQRLSPR